jgi:hypothetical protein
MNSLIVGALSVWLHALTSHFQLLFHREEVPETCYCTHFSLFPFF